MDYAEPRMLFNGKFPYLPCHVNVTPRFHGAGFCHSTSTVAYLFAVNSTVCLPELTRNCPLSTRPFLFIYLFCLSSMSISSSSFISFASESTSGTAPLATLPSTECSRMYVCPCSSPSADLNGQPPYLCLPLVVTLAYLGLFNKFSTTSCSGFVPPLLHL